MKLFGGKGHKTKKRGSSQPSSTTPSTPATRRNTKAKTNSVAPTTPPSSRAGEANQHSRRHRTTPKKGFSLKGWYAKLNGTQKGLLMLALSLVVLGGVVSAAVSYMVQPPERVATVATTTVTTVDEDGNEVIETVTAVNTVPTIDPDTGEEVEIEWEVPGSNKNGYYNILVVGTDNDGTRTDTIMIARLDTVEKTVALMSIPRDTLINSNSSVPKINSVYGNYSDHEDGIAALEKHLKSMLGFEVDGYVMVDLDAFIKVIDLIGGVEFDVPVNMYYNDPTQDLYINVAAGYQLLDGETAMGVVRYRSGYAGADITRTGVQQDFLKALALKLLDIGNLSKISQLAEIFVECVDTDLTLGNMIYMGSELLNCDIENMYTVTLPGQSVMVNDLSCYALYAGQVLDIVNEYFNPYDTDLTSGNLYIRTVTYYSSSTTTTTTSTSTDTSSTDDDDVLLDTGDEEIDEDDLLLEGDLDTEETEGETTDGTDASEDTTTDTTDSSTDSTSDSTTSDSTTSDSTTSDSTTTDSTTTDSTVTDEPVVDTGLLIA